VTRPVFSIVLATRDRAALLQRALEGLLELDFPPAQLELCLVDNASCDDTAERAAAFAARAPFAVQLLAEPKVGLSAARNRGVRAARGEYLFFTDDDQLVDPWVLREHQRVAHRYRVSAVQGAIELSFTAMRPAWLRGPLAAVLGETRRVPEGLADVDLYGGNMVLRRDVFDELAGFREDLGKGAAGYAEDVELTRRLRARGEPIAYAPSARIFHLIGPERASAAFLRRCSFEKGYSDGLIVPPARRAARALGALRGASTQSALSLLAAPFTHSRIVAQTRALDHLGRLVGLARAHARGQG